MKELRRTTIPKNSTYIQEIKKKKKRGRRRLRKSMSLFECNGASDGNDTNCFPGDNGYDDDSVVEQSNITVRILRRTKC